MLTLVPKRNAYNWLKALEHRCSSECRELLPGTSRHVKSEFS